MVLGPKGDPGISGTPGAPGLPGPKGSVGGMGLPGKLDLEAGSLACVPVVLVGHVYRMRSSSAETDRIQADVSFTRIRILSSEWSSAQGWMAFG